MFKERDWQVGFKICVSLYKSKDVFFLFAATVLLFLPLLCLLYLLHLCSDLTTLSSSLSPQYLLPLTSHLPRYGPLRGGIPETLESHANWMTGFVFVCVCKMFVHLQNRGRNCCTYSHPCFQNAVVNVFMLSPLLCRSVYVCVWLCRCVCVWVPCAGENWDVVVWYHWRSFISEVILLLCVWTAVNQRQLVVQLQLQPHHLHTQSTESVLSLSFHFFSSFCPFFFCYLCSFPGFVRFPRMHQEC